MYFGVESPFHWRRRSRRGRGKGLPLKVGQHIYCDGILYYYLYINPGDNVEEWQYHSAYKGGARDNQVMSWFLKRVYVYSVSYFMYLAWRPFRWRRRSRKGAWQRTSFKGWSTHILWLHSLLYLYFNPRVNERNNCSTQSKEGPRDDQVMSLFLQRLYVYSVSHFMYLAWKPFRWRRRSRRGRGKGLPLKVGQHIYCDCILYYTYILTPETMRGMTVPLSQKRAKQRSGYEFFFKIV